MKVSIITVVFNNSSTIRMAIDSVLNQTYKNIEYIVVDGASTDGTVDIIKSYGTQISKFISEPDKGIYNAMNKGVRLASGDFVGILNADDCLYSNDVIQSMVNRIDDTIDAVYGDVEFFSDKDLSRSVRYYSSKKFNIERFKYGFMPAHPSFYVRKKYFDLFGCYKEDYRIASDFDLLIRFLHSNKIKSKYIEMPFVKMRTGGVSNKNIMSRVLLNKEILRACKENNIKTNLFNIYSKYFIKIFELR